VAPSLLDLLLPQRCVACGLPGAQVCEPCLCALPRLRGPRCERCCAPTAWPVRRCRECAGRRLAFAQARAAVAYDDSVRRLVHAWKERGLRRLAAVAAALTADALDHGGEPLAFVPSDPERGRHRGHHPAEALARELGARWEVPVLALLARAGGSARQRGLTLAERRSNVRGAFSAARSPQRVVLVDDVYTSGATANAAASALRRAGARRVEVVTFARAVRGYTVTTQA
jgi:predicted amidophosphoribosyltransferase